MSLPFTDPSNIDQILASVYQTFDRHLYAEWDRAQ